MVMVSVFRNLPLAPMHIKKYSSKKHTPAKQLDTVEIALLLSAERLVKPCLDTELTYRLAGFYRRPALSILNYQGPCFI